MNKLEIFGDANEFVSHGKNHVLSGVTVNWEVCLNQNNNKIEEISLNIESKDIYFSLEFQAPINSSLLQGRSYPNCARAFMRDNDKQPGLSISSTGRGNNEVVGSFDIHTLNVKVDQVNLEISFQQQDDSGFLLRGRVWYSGHAMIVNVSETQTVSTEEAIASQVAAAKNSLFQPFSSSILDHYANDAPLTTSGHPLSDNIGFGNLAKIFQELQHEKHMSGEWHAFIGFRGKAIREYARQLERELDKNSLKAFVDEKAMGIGSHIDNTIKNAIAGSNYFILLATSNIDEESYVLKEISLFLEKEEKYNRLIILELFDDPISPEVIKLIRQHMPEDCNFPFILKVENMRAANVLLLPLLSPLKGTKTGISWIRNPDRFLIVNLAQEEEEFAYDLAVFISTHKSFLNSKEVRIWTTRDSKGSLPNKFTQNGLSIPPGPLMFLPIVPDFTKKKLKSTTLMNQRIKFILDTLKQDDLKSCAAVCLQEVDVLYRSEIFETDLLSKMLDRVCFQKTSNFEKATDGNQSFFEYIMTVLISHEQDLKDH